MLAETASSQPSPVFSFTGSQPGEARTIAGIAFRWCPSGSFQMGSPKDEEGRREDESLVDVHISQGFWMGAFEVTQGQWRRILGSLPPSMNKGAGDDYPIYWISYLESEEFCRKLTQQSWSSGQLPRGWEFRLPTEAQWEYACRAGTRTAFSFGDRLTRLQANYHYDPEREAGPPPSQAAKVGSYPPNAWGIYDMHGNVFEWCRDWYHPRLPGGADPDLSDEQGMQNRDGTYSRVRRGGAWNDPAIFCRSALRLRYEPDRRSDHIGLRIVAVPVR